jgi:hypothetical protein
LTIIAARIDSLGLTYPIVSEEELSAPKETRVALEAEAGA